MDKQDKYGLDWDVQQHLGAYTPEHKGILNTYEPDRRSLWRKTLDKIKSLFRRRK